MGNNHSLHHPLISLHAMIHFHFHGQHLLHLHSIASRNDSLSFSRATITMFTLAANQASRNDLLSFSWATINLPTSAANLVLRNELF